MLASSTKDSKNKNVGPNDIQKSIKHLIRVIKLEVVCSASLAKRFSDMFFCLNKCS